MWIVDCGGFSPNVINTIYWKVWKRKLGRSGEYVNVYLVNERDVVPEDHHLLIQIVVDGVGAVGGDGDALPLGAPVLDPVESHDGFALSGCWWADVGDGGGWLTDLEDVVEHGSCVFVERLSLAGLEDDQASPGVSDVGTVPPPQLVLLVLHLQPQRGPGYPVLACKYQSSSSLSCKYQIFSNLYKAGSRVYRVQ